MCGLLLLLLLLFNSCRHNGEYVQTHGLMELVLMDKLLALLLLLLLLQAQWRLCPDTWPDGASAHGQASVI
jgi:hypothetical protein